MTDTRILARALSRLRGLFANRRRLAAALAVADTVLVPAALVVWLPLLGPEAATVPPVPSTSPPERPVTTRPELPAPPPPWEQPAPPAGGSSDVPPWFPQHPTEAVPDEPSLSVPPVTTSGPPRPSPPDPEPTVPVTEPPEPTPTDGEGER